MGKLFNNQPVLDHNRLQLIPMEESHAKALLDINDPSIWDFMLLRVSSLEEMENWVNAAINGRENEQLLPYVVRLKETGEIIGTTRTYGFDFQNRSCEIGSTWYAKKFQRSFVNTACKLTLLQFCFEELHMIRVQFKTDERNVRSQKAIERLGAKKEGILRNERILQNGYIRNACVYSITAEEWPVVKKDLLAKEDYYKTQS
ncbi:GNAT family protein [Bacillus sp. FJAT-49736]|uniref:GNAT family N-acetyltransferase n=1 Tax=Bacillus sp. FJAT-49736 TaxID=2833582 RepID=UPI001BC9DF91|nr:GNAT family protein [Bacillus sp. FJAT-49736]MBS4175633.1 GNAT family N-acetyltransferase [Bacillus sp. FJAT-49736]